MALFYMRGIPIGYVAVMLALMASMGGFIFGYDTGQISDILIMDDFLTRFGQCGTAGDASTCHFSDVRSGLIVALLSIGTLIGALCGAPVADYLGRRRAMTAECFVFTIGVIIQLASVSAWYQFAIGRLVAGWGVGALSAAVPMYQAETAPAQIRGTLTATYQLFITFGILVAYCISIGTRDASGSASWRIVVGISILWAAILAFGILTMPESPRWLAKRNDLDGTRRSIAIVRGLPLDDHIVTRDVNAIVAHLQYEESIKQEQGAGWLRCFRGLRKQGRDRSMIGYRTLLGMTLQMFQQLTGANYFFYYGTIVFQSVGIEDPFVTQIILGAVNFFCTFGGLYVMERFGRRRPLIIGGIWQSMWLFVFAAAGTAQDPMTHPGIGKLMIVSACMFIFGYAMTWGPGIWILIGETFPTATRAKQAALSTASNWLWNFLLAFFTPFIIKSIAFKYGFVFACCNLMGAIIVFFFLYESSGLTLEHVDDMYRDPLCKPWTSISWAPEGYASRHDAEAEIKAKGDVDEVEHSEGGQSFDNSTAGGTYSEKRTSNSTV